MDDVTKTFVLPTITAALGWTVAQVWGFRRLQNEIKFKRVYDDAAKNITDLFSHLSNLRKTMGFRSWTRKWNKWRTS